MIDAAASPRTAPALAAMLAAVVFATAWPAFAGNGVTTRRDEFGVIPAEPRDKDLVMPDPVLDRTWAGPKPGEGPRTVEKEPEEDDDRVPEPEGEDEGVRPSKRGDESKEAGSGHGAPRSPGLVVGPDGRRDPGSPAPEVDPSLPDVLGKDAPDLSDLERDEARPSMHGRGGDDSDREDGAGGSGGAGE